MRVGCRPISTVSGFSVERVADDVVAAGKIKHAMRVDGLLDRGGVVGRAVALHAERVDVDPVCRRRQRAESRGGSGAGSALSGAAS